MGKKMHGKDGEDRIIPVPVGTIIKDADTEEVLADLDSEGVEIIIAKAGRGRTGEMHTSQLQQGRPQNLHSPGEEGEEKILLLS